MFMAEKKPIIGQMEAAKNVNKRSYDEFDDNFSMNNNNNLTNERKKAKMEIINNVSNTNCTSFAKNDKLILSKNLPISSFQEKFHEIFKDYPDTLKSNIEKTLNDFKNEGYTVKLLINFRILRIDFCLSFR